ncbi:MAG: hypothetical protein AAFR39_00200 [Pseudomonadota bacterium]
MRMTTLTLAAAVAMSASTAFAYDCNWGASKMDTVAEAPMTKMTHMPEVAKAQTPVDGWLVKYLENWQKA